MLLLSCPSLLVASAVRPIQLWALSLDGGGVWLRWAICCGRCKAGVNCKRHYLLSVASTIDRWTFYACEMTSLDYWLFVLRSGIELNYVCGSHSTAIWYSSWWCDVTYTVFQKGRCQIHGGNSVTCQPIFKIFPLSDSPINLQQSIY